jgi:hypothetical protein
MDPATRKKLPKTEDHETAFMGLGSYNYWVYSTARKGISKTTSLSAESSK